MNKNPLQFNQNEFNPQYLFSVCYGSEICSGLFYTIQKHATYVWCEV